MIDDGDPGEVLSRLAAGWNADLLVIGDRGSAAARARERPEHPPHKAPCSVYVVETT